MKKSCLYFDKKMQICILHSPLQRSYLNKRRLFNNTCWLPLPSMGNTSYDL